MAMIRLATTVVGSYPQPDWLVDRAMLAKGVPRIRLRAMWRVPEEFLTQARDDATVLAIRDIEPPGSALLSDREFWPASASSPLTASLRVRAGVARRAAAGHTHRTLCQHHRGAGSGRADSPPPARRGARHPVPPPPHRPPGQDHAAGALHDGPAGQQRVLPGRGRD